MTLETLYFATQILAAFAVLASILFLGVQMRDSTRERKLQRQFEINRLTTTLSDLTASEGRLPEVVTTGMRDYRSLTAGDKFRFNNAMAKVVRSVDLVHKLYLEGDATRDELDAIQRMAYSVLITEGGKIWWHQTGMATFFTPDTRAMVDAMYERGAELGWGMVPDIRNEAEKADDT